MRIGPSSFQPILFKTVKEKEVKVSDMPQSLEVKQGIREMVQRRIAEIEEARTDMGEDDPKAQLLIEKIKSGKKLTSEEMNYIRKNAPGMVEYIERIMREREIIELGMKLAPTKTDVHIVALHAAKQIEKHHNPEEREIRAKHLADAKHEYEKTDDYKDKPNSPLDEEKKSDQIKHKRNSTQYSHIAIQAYEQTKIKSRG